jgi:hypothetical protein
VKDEFPPPLFPLPPGEGRISKKGGDVTSLKGGGERSYDFIQYLNIFKEVNNEN